jgi:hypothetical protein
VGCLRLVGSLFFPKEDEMKRTWIAVILAALLLAGCVAGRVVSQAAPEGAPAVSFDYVDGRGGGEVNAWAAPSAANEVKMRASSLQPGYQGTAVTYDAAGRADFMLVADSASMPAQDRLVIRNADLAVVVADPSQKMDAISKMAEEMGGWVVASNVYQTQTVNNVEVTEGTITIRVPAEKLDEALTKIKEGTSEILSESSSGQDVTAEYVDLQSKLKTYEEADAQLSKILETKTESEEVLAVFQQKMAYEEQINLLKGQIKYYNEAAAMSAINVRVVAEESIQPLEIAGWKPQGVARDAAQALIDFFKGFVNFLIWLVIFVIPVLVMVGLPGWGIFLGVRAIVRAARRKKVTDKAEK